MFMVFVVIFIFLNWVKIIDKEYVYRFIDKRSLE